MNSERQAIVGLIAARRISAAEAERLLRAFNEGREGLWIVLACVIVCLAQVHLQISPHEVGHWAQWAISGWTKAVHMAGGVLLKGMGGRV